jgi:hypothetical protein
MESEGNKKTKIKASQRNIDDEFDVDLTIFDTDESVIVKSAQYKCRGRHLDN